ncbi:MAG TPA: hypothetical protein VMD59_05720 [Acidimicrobiales bacterium]|nr:hypothetical protein [Acidimicrobiales bacterium]
MSRRAQARTRRNLGRRGGEPERIPRQLDGPHVIAHATWRNSSLVPPTWHVVGSAHARAGYAAIHLHLRALFATHKTVPILLTGGGGGYRTSTPVTAIVNLAGAD